MAATKTAGVTSRGGQSSSPTPTPGLDPRAWDCLWLRYSQDNDPAPGVATVEVDREYKVDEKEPNGANGGCLTIGGRKLAKVSITLRLWAPEHFQRADVFLEALFPRLSKPKPFDCAHPVLQHHKLKSLFFKSYKGPRSIGDDEFEIHLDAVEFVPPPPAPPPSAVTQLIAGAALPTGWKRDIYGGAISPAQQEWDRAKALWAQGKGPYPSGPRPTGLPTVPAGTPAPALPPKAPPP